MADPQKRRRNSRWEKSPEWVAKIQTIARLESQGYDAKQIANVSGIPEDKVIWVQNDERLALEKAAKNFREKIPVIKDIMGLSLDGLRERMKDLADPALREEMLPNIGSMATLTRMLVDLNGILRLEQGQSTENVQTLNKSYKETRVMLQDLRKVDPIFEYPELPEPPSSA